MYVYAEQKVSHVNNADHFTEVIKHKYVQFSAKEDQDVAFVLKGNGHDILGVAGHTSY